MRKPLSATVYLRRNASRTLPLLGVIVLAVALIAGIVAMMNSIPYSVKTIYDHSKYYLGVSPRGDVRLTPEVRRRILEESPVEVGRVVTVRASEAEVRSIVGPWPFVVLGMDPDDVGFYLERTGSTELRGRTPADGQAEALISEPVARNLGLELGDTLLAPDTQEAYSPNPVEVVGIVETERWIMVADRAYYEENHFPPIDLLLVFAADPAQQDALDRWAVETFRGERARMYAWHVLERETDAMFEILYSILNVVIGTLVAVITLMMTMLMNIYQSQRVQEFGLLQAIGYTKRALLSRVLIESALVVVFGWALGLGAAYALLSVVEARLMDPNAFALDTLDRVAYLYTIPVPIAIFVAASLTVLLRMRRYDPVGVVERRLV